MNYSIPYLTKNPMFCYEIDHFFSIITDAYNFAVSGRSSIENNFSDTVPFDPHEIAIMDCVFSLYNCILHDAETIFYFYKTSSYNYALDPIVPPIYYRNLRFNIECLFDIFLLIFDENYYDEYKNMNKNMNYYTLSQKGIKVKELGFDNTIEDYLWSCTQETNIFVHTSFIFEPKVTDMDKNNKVKELIMNICMVTSQATNLVLSYIKSKGIDSRRKVISYNYWIDISIDSFEPLAKYQEFYENANRIDALCPAPSQPIYYPQQ